MTSHNDTSSPETSDISSVQHNGEQTSLSTSHEQPLDSSSPEFSISPQPLPFGGVLYVIGGLLTLGCMGGVMQLFQVLLGGEQVIAPSFIGATIQLLSTGITLVLFIWATVLFFRKSRKFKIWYALALIATSASGFLLWYFIPQDPTIADQQIQGVMLSSLIYMCVIYYLFTAERPAKTFINQ